MRIKFVFLYLCFSMLSFAQTNVSAPHSYNMQRRSNNVEVHKVKQEIQQHVKEEVVAKQSEWSDKIIVTEHEDTIRTSFVQSEEKVSLPDTKPIILFDKGKSVIRPEFKAVLDKFIPNYVKLLRAHKVRSITLRGFASTEGKYDFNMQLSQDRADAVKTYCLGLLNSSDRAWFNSILKTQGLGPSLPIILEDGQEDRVHSRRVEIDVVIDE